MIDISDEVEMLQDMLISIATGGPGDIQTYKSIRNRILNNPHIKELAPRFLRTCRTSDQFWSFIKHEFVSYAERRAYIWNEFRPLLERLDASASTPSDSAVSTVLQQFDPASIHLTWQRALERRESDAEGAITLARTLLESVCKHILDEHTVAYKRTNDLPGLYHLTSQCLNIAPSQHSELIFKQILGGCTSVVEGLGALRNRLSDAHGQGKRPIKPAPRHAGLAVNLAGAVALFLIETNNSKVQ
jgi:hypothetical protein